MKSRYKIVQKWRNLITSLPGYDPFKFAGDCWLDERQAQTALDFFPMCLQHVKGPKAKNREPFKLERWERAIIANLFGWKRSDGLRRYRVAFIFVPKKNGKTPLAAGMILYVLCCDNEPGAEIYSSANDRAQASLIFSYAELMVKASAELSRRLKVFRNSIVAIDPDTGIETGSFYKPISSEAYTKHGYNTHVHINDELHAMQDRELIDVLEGSTMARSQPLTIYITTSDYVRESICNEKYDYACKVRDGVIPDAGFLPVIYEAAAKDDWKSPATWKKANPNYGVSFSASSFRQEFNKAVEIPAYENTFKRLHLNMRTEQETRLVPMEHWQACDGQFDENELVGKKCFVGFDLSSNTDITARIMLFPPQADCNLWRILCRFYLPHESAEKRQRRDKVPYLLWADEGRIMLTPGNVVSYDRIKADFISDYGRFAMTEIAFDRWNFEGLRQQFLAEGMDQKRFISFGQGYASMSAPTKELLKLILAHELAHNANPVLTWMAGNVAAETDAAGNIKPSKARSGERIDGIVALIMALGRAMVTPKPKESVYRKRGIIWV